MAFAGPHREIGRASEYLEGHGVILHRAGSIRAHGLKAFIPARAVIRTIRVADLQIQCVAREDSEEYAAVIEPDATEHRARRHVAQLLQLVEHERLEGGADRQRPERATVVQPWPDAGWHAASGHATTAASF